MRLGGPVFINGTDPEEYALAHVKKGFGAALCPWWLTLERPAEVAELKRVMKKHDVRIAEVGAWCNPLSPDKAEAEEKINYMIERLRLAEELGAATCVNILGSKNPLMWDGADKAGYTEEFFKESVAVSQRILDAVRPENTTLSFEMMPHYFLDGPQEYLHFLDAVDRPAAAVHLDICNTMNHPRRFYNNAAFIKEAFALLADKIVTMHLKDIAMEEECLTVRLNEVLIGTGGMDYHTLMEEIGKLPEDTPAMLEHLETEAQYDMAQAATERFAKEAGLVRKGLCWVRG